MYLEAGLLYVKWIGSYLLLAENSRTSLRKVCLINVQRYAGSIRLLFFVLHLLLIGFTFEICVALSNL